MQPAPHIPSPWNLDSLTIPPAIHPAPGFSEPGAQALFYEALPWKGSPTRAFAWLGFPKRRADEKVPGIVLVHGGGGTAFAEWVRLWTGRGYAAIAMDTCGCTPGGGHGNRPRHDHGGPPGWGGWDQVEWLIEDQWTFHAIADVLLATSLLRARPEVDPARIGITGISWGGFLTCIVAGIDPRLKFAAPVYGCGFVHENERWRPRLETMGERNAAQWRELWEPALYLPAAKMPMLWINGTNDIAFPMNAHQKSYRLPKGERTLSIPVRMPHDHGGPGENPPEILAFANSHFKNKPPLARVTGASKHGPRASLNWPAAVPVVRAELNFTTDAGPWKDRLWQSVPAPFTPEETALEADLPGGVTAFYINLIDQRGLMVSTEHWSEGCS